MTTTSAQTAEARAQIVNLVRDFVRREVEPIANRYDNEDVYPHELVAPMREMGLFGITIPEEYGGMGLDYTTFAMIFEELSKGWMSVSGIIGTHHVLAHVVATGGTEEQKQRFLPRMAAGEIRGGLGLTEPDAGSDVAELEHYGPQGRRRVRAERIQDVHNQRRERQRLRRARKDGHRSAAGLSRA